MRTPIGFTILAALLVTAAGHHPACAKRWPATVTAALEDAGANRANLTKVLARYAAPRDSLKFKAACFLIGNMSDHCYARLALYDSAHVEVDFDILAYPTYEAMMAAVDSLEARRGTVDYDRRDIIPDLTTMPASLLIENIELAFRAWREKPWARHLSFDEFCEYVLPYRGSNEPLETWRPYFLQRFARLPRELKDPTDPVAAACSINRVLMNLLRFDARYYLHPTDQGLHEMLTTHLGRCEDMTNFTIYAMRANGIGVTSDYTPYWADTGNNHAWNAVLDRDGKVVMFMGAEANPGEYSLSHRAAKVYRKTFAEQPGNLVCHKPSWEKVPGWLAGKHYVDVTGDYMEVIDLAVPLEQPVPDSVHYAYLCVFNSGEWQPVHWGAIDNGRAVFTQMGLRIAYLPAYFVHEKIVPAGPAFILAEGGAMRPLIASGEAPIDLQLTATQNPIPEQSPGWLQYVSIETGRPYELFYWHDAWVSVGKTTATDPVLTFNAVPKDALYWLVKEGKEDEDRIFTYDNDAQVWW